MLGERGESGRALEIGYAAVAVDPLRESDLVAAVRAHAQAVG